MNPVRLLGDRRGRLLEIPLLIAYLGVSLAVGFGERSWWKGPVYAAAGFAAVIGVLVAWVAVVEKLESVPFVERLMQSRLAERLGAAVAYAIGLVGGGALGGFVSLFAAARAADAPEARLRVMRLFVLAGAALGAAVVFRERRRPARF